MQRFPQPLGESVPRVCPPWQPPVRTGTSLCQSAVNVCFMHLPFWDCAGKVRSMAKKPRVAWHRAQVAGPSGVTENSQCCSLHRVKSETVCSRQLTSVSTEKYQYFLHIDQHRVENFGSNNQVSRLISMCLKMFLLLFTDEGLERA